jgi:hypothetical protein
MELYVDKEEGVALINSESHNIFACYTLVGGNFQECASREEYKTPTTRILASGGTEDGYFNLNFQFASIGSGAPQFTVDKQLQVGTG